MINQSQQSGIWDKRWVLSISYGWETEHCPTMKKPQGTNWWVGLSEPRCRTYSQIRIKSHTNIRGVWTHYVKWDQGNRPKCNLVSWPRAQQCEKGPMASLSSSLLWAMGQKITFHGDLFKNSPYPSSPGKGVNSVPNPPSLIKKEAGGPSSAPNSRAEDLWFCTLELSLRMRRNE